MLEFVFKLNVDSINSSLFFPYLLALHTLHSKLLLIAGDTEVVALLGYEALGADGLLASLAGEAGLVPAIPLVLHLPGAFKVQLQVNASYTFLNSLMLGPVLPTCSSNLESVRQC